MLEPRAEAQQLPFRTSLGRGARLGVPILLGYAPVGAAFGVLACTLGFSPAQAIVCSATSLAGAGQFIALSVLGSGESAAAVIAATTVVNLRYVLFGATISPRLAGLPARWQALLAFTLTDETFAVNISDLRRGAADRVSMAAVGAVAWLGWVAGTAAGALGAGVIGDPAKWGVEFAMPAMFTALLVDQAEGRRHVAAAALAAVIALAAAAWLPGKWYILIASTLAAAIASAVRR